MNWNLEPLRTIHYRKNGVPAQSKDDSAAVLSYALKQARTSLRVKQCAAASSYKRSCTIRRQQGELRTVTGVV